MGVSQAEFRKAMGSFATGVTVITVDYEGEVHGMTANAFASVSLDPMLVLVCVDHKARTHTHLHARKRFGVNVLAENQRAVSEYYADPNPDHRYAEREARARFDRTQHGTPVLHGRSGLSGMPLAHCARCGRPYDFHCRSRGCRGEGGRSVAVFSRRVPEGRSCRLAQGFGVVPEPARDVVRLIR